MTELILHHYELSPFSEKVRRILAWKRLAWTAVRAPAVMPKPDLVALSGGYRKIPVLQIGNHVYCDSALIADVLEREQPERTLYPTPLARSLAEWADGALFESMLPVAMRPTRFDDLLRWLTPDEQQRIVEDRREMRKDALRVAPPPKAAMSHFGAYLKRLEASLGASEYLLGAAPCIADFSVYHCLWFVQHMAPERLAGCAKLEAWMGRIAALPEPTSTPISSERALEVSRRAEPNWTSPEPFADPLGIAEEALVVVRATDYGRDAISGALVASSTDELVLRRQDERAGCVYVHFPRLGYEVSPVAR